MAGVKKTSAEKRWEEVKQRGLDDEVDIMETILQRHLATDGQAGVRELMRKEIGGSIWQHGGEGKVLGYKSTKDLTDELGLHAPEKKKTKSTSKKTSADNRSKTSHRVNRKQKPAFGPVLTGHSVGMPPSNEKGRRLEEPKVKECDNITAPAADQHLNDTFTIPTGSVDVKGSVERPRVPSDHPITSSLETNDSDYRAHVLNKMFVKLNIEEKLKDFKTDTVCGEDEEHLTCDLQVMKWLESLHLKDPLKYGVIFAKHEIDMESLKLLTEHNFKEMGITALGSLNKMLVSIKDMKCTSKGPSAFDVSSKSTISSRKKTVVSGGNRTPKPHPDPDIGSKADLIPSQPKESHRTRPHDASKTIKKGQAVATSVVKSQKTNKQALIAKATPKNSSKIKITDSENKTSGGGRNHDSISTVTQGKSHKKESGPHEQTTRPRPRPASARPIASKKGCGGSDLGSKVKRRPKSAVPIKSADDSLDLLAEKINAGVFFNEHVSDGLMQDDLDLDDPHGLDDLLSVRRAPQHTLSSRSVSFAEPEVTYNTDSDSGNNSHTDIRLQDIENQIRQIPTELSNPSAMKLIVGLEEQLREVQREIQQQKKCMLTSQSQQPSQAAVISKPAIDCETVLNELSLAEMADNETSAIGTQGGGEDAQSAASIQPAPLQTGTSEGVPNMAVASRAMSKTELLKQVRQQKDQHRKEIRHLESELSRLKHKDPLRSCQVELRDLTYSETDLLGEGGFSRVFRGTYQGSTVAVKRLKVPLSAQDKNYFTAEVSLLRELRHPRVVLLLGVHMSSSHLPLMLLEYMSEGSLYNYIHNPDKPPFDHAAYYQIAQDMALGMNYLHRHRPSVLHLDLKSMNVLLTSHLHAKIADFGFSKLRHEADTTQAKKVTGSPSWMSPELLDVGQISTKADVYSFGIILWEMLSREHPYQGCSVFQVIERVRRGRRPIIPDTCPDQLETLIRTAWAHNPAVRPPFQDIIPTLESLHFPSDWRTLFKAAGIPRAVLEHVETSRTLIDIVTSGMEYNHTQPSHVPPLQLDLGEDDPKTKVMSDSSSEADPPPVSCSKKTAWSSDPPPPPPPPVPPLNLMTSSSQNYTQSLPPATDIFQELKASFQGAHLRSVGSASQERPAKATAVKGKGHNVSEADLQRQMLRLKPTIQPHPSQLRDLSRVEGGQFNDLAEMLKQAVVERRWALHSEELSTSSSIWSSDSDG